MNRECYKYTEMEVIIHLHSFKLLLNAYLDVLSIKFILIFLVFMYIPL